MRLNRKVLFLAVLVVSAGALAATALRASKERAWIDGAVLVEAADADEQAPIASVAITARYRGVAVAATSDPAGFFHLVLPPGTRPGQPIVLTFRHPDYRPAELRAAAGDELVVTRMTPVVSRSVTRHDDQAAVVGNLRVRYSIATRSLVNIGAGVRMFQAVNRGNVRCNGRAPCSPDGKWKAGVGAASLDAGPENEFRNARVSCIAGPCPFTRIDVDNFSRGGRVIGVSVRNWSDTTTFVLQAEVVRPEISNVVRYTYPVILGRTMNFTLPAAAEGPSIEAEIGGVSIVFPLGPNLFLSWAACDARPGSNQSRTYRCELKPGYRFAE